jgi:WD40 repeat protein
VADAAGEVTVLDSRTGAVRRTLARRSAPVRGLKWGAGDRMILVHDTVSGPTTYDAGNGRLAWVPRGVTVDGTAALAPAGDRVVLAARDGTLLDLDPTGRRTFATRQSFGASGRELAWWPDGRRYSVGLLGGVVRTLGDGVVTARVKGDVEALAVNAVGTRLAVATGPDYVTVLDASGEPQGDPLRTPPRVRDVAWVGDDVVVASTDGSVRRWRPGGSVRWASGGELPVRVAVDSTGQRVAVSRVDGSVTLLDSDDGRVLVRITTGDAPVGPALAFAGDVLWLGRRDGSVTRHDVTTGRQIGRAFGGHAAPVAELAVRPGAPYVVSAGGADGSVLVRGAAGEPLVMLPSRGSGPKIALADGGTLLVLARDGVLTRWDLLPTSWSEHACRLAGRALTRAEWDVFLPDRGYDPACRSQPARR